MGKMGKGKNSRGEQHHVINKNGVVLSFIYLKGKKNWNVKGADV